MTAALTSGDGIGENATRIWWAQPTLPGRIAVLAVHPQQLQPLARRFHDVLRQAVGPGSAERHAGHILLAARLEFARDRAPRRAFASIARQLHAGEERVGKPPRAEL